MRTGWSGSTAERIERLGRSLGLGHNPLRRRCDTIEARILAGLLAVALICGPLLAVVAFRWAAQAGIREQHKQQAWRQVSATLLRPASGDVMAADGSWALARWTAPDGQVRMGDVPVLGTGWAGTTVRMWVDAQGWPTGQPLSRGQLRGRAVGAAVLATTFAVLLLAGLGLLAHVMADRRRLAGWDAAWASTEPSWTRRSGP